MREIKKVKLIGLGAMGSFFAPRLSQLLGDNFRIIVSGSRKKRFEETGVTINGINYKFPIDDPENAEASDLPERKADLIIIAVKGYGLDTALKDIRPYVGGDTLIMSVLNGVDSEEQVIKAYGEQHVLYSFMRVSIVMKDGITSFDPNLGFVHFGDKINVPGKYSEAVQAVAALFHQAGIPYQIDEDMLRGIWYKFACNIGENMTCAMLGIPFGAFHTSENANFVRRAGMREVIRIAQAKGIRLGEADVAAQDKTLLGVPAFNKPSTLQDLEAGKKTEIDMFAGTVIRLGRELSVPTPVAEIYYYGIKALEDKNDGIFN